MQLGVMRQQSCDEPTMVVLTEQENKIDRCLNVTYSKKYTYIHIYFGHPFSVTNNIFWWEKWKKKQS